MLSDRLNIALDAGIIEPPASGRIAVLEPALGTDLSNLPKDQMDVVTRRINTYRHFEAEGYDTSVSLDGTYRLSILSLPRAKDEARAMIAAAMAATEGPVVIDGQKTDGIDSVLKAVRRFTDVDHVMSKAHGKLFIAESADFSDWAATGSTELQNGFVTAPGVFSADGIDPGSAALIAALPAKMDGHVIDLGAGWGILSDAALKAGATSISLVEADFLALEAAKSNITDPRATFHWDDALTFQTETAADHVITNPPFHTSRKADPSLGQGFIRSAARLLKRSGTLWLVANRHLPYERVLEDCFREIETLGQTPQYKLIRAAKPRSSQKGKS